METVVEVVTGSTLGVLALLGILSAIAMFYITRNRKMWEVVLERQRKDYEDRLLSDRKFFYEHGRAKALAEMNRIREDRSVGYREAAKVVRRVCASCDRKCLHCALAEQHFAPNSERRIQEAFDKVNAILADGGGPALPTDTYDLVASELDLDKTQVV